MKFSEKVGNGPTNKWLNFGGDPFTDPDTARYQNLRRALAEVCTVPVLLVSNFTNVFERYQTSMRILKTSTRSTFETKVTTLALTVANFYFAPERGRKYCDLRIPMSVCLFVCLSARVGLSQKPHFLASRNIYFARRNSGEVL